jgi:putative ABC transport system ATP-binding protein
VSGEDALEARGLSKHYGEGDTLVLALRETTFSVARGEVVAIVGPSGSGKSTLLTVLGLVNPPASGSLAIGGREVYRDGLPLGDLAAFRRRHMGYVFQRSNLIPFLNALENVSLVLELDDVPPREARREARALLETLGVGERLGHWPAMMSGGEQQRVAIARALVSEPAVVLADEPTAALDGPRGRQIMELFRRAARERGAAVIVVTHDHRTLDLVDRVLEMEDGTLRAPRAVSELGRPG